MAAVAIVTAGRAPTPTAKAHPKAYLATDTGLRCVLPIAPADVEHGGYADEWATVEREGRKPAVIRTADGLRSMSCDLFVASQQLGVSVEPRLLELKAIAASAARVSFSYGTQERGVWRLTGCRVTVTERQHGTNDATKANVALTFLEASDVVVSVGPLSGGHKAPPKVAAAKGKTTTADRTHVLRAGETLTAVATRFYGDGSLWQKLATLNKISDPRMLKVGTRLRVPARLP